MLCTCKISMVVLGVNSPKVAPAVDVTLRGSYSPGPGIALARLMRQSTSDIGLNWEITPPLSFSDDPTSPYAAGPGVCLPRYLEMRGVNKGITRFIIKIISECEQYTRTNDGRGRGGNVTATTQAKDNIDCQVRTPMVGAVVMMVIVQQ